MENGNTNPGNTAVYSLLLIEVMTTLSSDGGIYLLFNYNMSPEINFIGEIVHHVGDFLMLMFYPIFVAYALPIKALKPLTTSAGRYAVYAIGIISAIMYTLVHQGVIESDIDVHMSLYAAMVIMFVVIFVISLAGVNIAKTKLAKEKALAFVFAFGFRDLAWATVYLSVMTGWIEKAPILMSQLYVGAILIYIPIMTYGILKLQMLDIEIRLKSTIKNSVLAGIFIGLFYLISEGANTLLSDQLGGLIGFAASALLTLFLTPLHRWAERFSSKLISEDTASPDYPATRSLQIYSAAVEDTLAYGEVTQGHIALLDRLKDSLQVSNDDATRLEQDLAFNRAAVPA